MFFRLKILFLSTSINFFLFLFLMISIQNSSNQSKLNLFSKETINLPISFIVGTSFICGSIIGSISKVLYFDNKEKEF